MKLVIAHILIALVFPALVEINFASAQVWTLPQCIDTALLHNKSLQMNRNNVAIAKQKQQESKANLIPKIAISADYKYFSDLPYQLMPLSVFGGPEGQFKEAQFGVPHSINAGIQLSMPIYNPQLYGAIQSASIASELTEIQYQKSEEQVYFEISNLYYNAQILHHQLAFIDSNLTNAEHLLRNMQLLFEQSMAKSTDVDKIRLQIAQLNTQKESVISKTDQVMTALKFAMGIPLDREIRTDPNIEYQNPYEYTRSTVSDIRIAKLQNRLITNEIRTLNRSRYLPSISIYGTYGTSGFGYDKQPNAFLKFYPISFAGIQLSYSLFNGTVTQHKINQKQFELSNSELQLGLVTEQNNMQVTNAQRQISVARKTVETTSSQILLAQSIYTQICLQQKEGIASLTDVLMADNALREAQQAYLAAVIDYLRADLELKKLTGNISTTK